jgi:hypothetical protein
MSRQQARVTTISSSAIITSDRAVFMGMQLGTDGANDPVITIYDGTDNAGNEIVPTATYDASVLGLNGLLGPYDKRAYNGIYVEITTGGTVEVTVDYRPI